MKIVLLLIVVFIILILGLVFLEDKNVIVEPAENNTVSEVNKKETTLERCFSRSTIATPEKPFSVEEHLKLIFKGNKVEGTKFGFQSGPGYSNGYTGALTGEQKGTEIVVNYSYIVEGSSNTEQEVYLLTSTTLEKIQYQLLDKGNMLVPDRTQEVDRIPYNFISCDAFEVKLP